MQPDVPIGATSALLNNNQELKLLSRRKIMKQYLLLTSALAVLGLSGTAEAACIQTPNCTTLGYTSTTACEGGLKCPWGNAWFCNVGGGSSTPDYSNCKIGDILYSDMSCNAKVVASKTPIGVVFDRANRLAIGLEESRQYWSYPDQFKVPGLSNMTSSAATADWQGKNNTRVVLEFCKANGKSCSAFEYVNSYKTEGTIAGDWYLPAMGELNAIYGNKDVLNIALGKIGGTKLGTSYYWSSSENSYRDAWYLIFSDGYVYYDSKGDRSGYVRPVLAF